MRPRVWYGIALSAIVAEPFWYLCDGYGYVSDMPSALRLLPMAFGTFVVFSLLSVAFTRKAALYLALAALAANVAVICAALAIPSGDASHRVAYLLGMFSNLTYWLFSAAIGGFLVHISVPKLPPSPEA